MHVIMRPWLTFRVNMIERVPLKEDLARLDIYFCRCCETTYRTRIQVANKP